VSNEWAAFMAKLEQYAPASVNGVEDCPKRNGKPCEVQEWYYDYHSIHPRSYGRCDHCRSHIIVFLGRRVPWNDYWGHEGQWEQHLFERLEQDPGHACKLLTEASERVLLQSGWAQRLYCVGDGGAVRLSHEIGIAAAHYAKSLVENAKEDLKRQADALFDEKFKLRTHSTRRWRTIALKAREAEQAIKPRLIAARKELAGLRDAIAEEREVLAGLREARQRPQVSRAEAAFSQPPWKSGDVICAAPVSQWVVYALVDPREPAVVRYVGKTKDALGRYSGHCFNGATNIKQWVENLFVDGVWPQMICIEVVSEETVLAREGHWIRHYRMSAQADLNVSIPREAAVA
jgi:hypothetical protein